MNLLSIEITMTSLEVVDLINKFREEEGNRALLTHPHFMRDIRKEIKDLENAGENIGESKIGLTSYIDKQGKSRPCYRMSRSWVMQMCNKESALVRYKTQQYIERLEQALQDLKFRQGDKKHQLQCMEILQDLLPEELKQEKVSYIKANTVVNKVTSNIFGFPKMLRKKEMNNEMLEVREKVLDEYLKLYEVLENNHLVTETLNKKYERKLLSAEEIN
ncbi:Rha family transcriptional regulator [Clostridium sp.]|uniref:Rha family transcriptional regulator n=1 Tax=Clostridium sp. TaxID=1506 RepID=UPI003992B71A